VGAGVDRSHHVELDYGAVELGVDDRLERPAYLVVVDHRLIVANPREAPGLLCVRRGRRRRGRAALSPDHAGGDTRARLGEAPRATIEDRSRGVPTSTR